MATPRLGIIGLGTFGINHLRCFRQLGYTGTAQLVAGGEINESLLEERQEQFDFTPYSDYAEMLEKEQLDGVTVVTPDHLHKDIVLAAAQAGVNVLCEKPLDVTAKGCVEMIEACQKAGVLLQVDFHKRYDQYHRRMRQKLAAGDLGDIEYGYAHMEDRIEVPRDWFPQWAKNSSPAWFLGIHFYDLARWLLQADGQAVWATGRQDKLAELGVGGWDSISAKVVFDNGATVAFDTAWILPDGFPAVVNQGIRLVGTEGMLECDSQDRGTMTVCTGDEPMNQTHNESFLRVRSDVQGREVWEGYGMTSIEHFVTNVNLLLEGGTLQDLGDYPDGNDGLQATKIATAVHESLETGNVVQI